MEYRARISFTGPISMYQNEVRELTEDKAVSLVTCGYLELVNKCEQEPLPAENEVETLKDSQQLEQELTQAETEQTENVEQSEQEPLPAKKQSKSTKKNTEDKEQ